ncbi:enhanced intracellular survival protein Eis [[Mycobacterium] nativiensis]|uniref:Enhanced intracellular survival protein Eis n=1 Tax=[Mycobacterium] nativiensis TaxID=2855503 RepID=A0ABU5Y5T5_9MYCO|nr:enhanced intracellular survival protein Eis [Mycolicibacter sp. MYC340]MEB3034310.1 enhanced intracellular survival protein Eis [Mycolicibacter sp. MYC340]
MHDAVSESLTLRTATDDDWVAMSVLAATGFGEDWDSESMTAWRTLTTSDSSLVVCDGDDVVGMSGYLDLELTVPGGAVLPAAGVSFVVVAPTHRRRGVLRSMYTELHRRIADSGYPIAALTASEGGIYGRFGYGPATVEHELTVDRRFVHLHADAPDPGGVRLVKPAGHRDAFAAIYQRWREQTPGGLARPLALWDDLLADRENTRDGGTAWFGLLHPDGYVLYRVHGGEPKSVRVGEFRAVTPAAHVALWRALLGLDLMGKIVVGTHPDDPMPYLLTDTRLATTTGQVDDLWLRIMDIPAVLQARSYALDLSVVVQVTDGFRSDGGRFALVIRDGRAACTPTDAPADVELDLDVLGSLYLGAHRASALAAASRLRCHDGTLVRRLDAAFVSDVPAQIGYGF